MALAAGLALLARVSMGVGLYAALGLLVLAMLVREPSPGGEPQRAASGATPLLARLVSSQFMLPMLVLLGFAILTGLVNYQRWGHSLVFADYRLYITNEGYPDRLPRTAAYGLFFSSRRRHTICLSDWSSDVCSSDLLGLALWEVYFFWFAGSFPSVNGMLGLFTAERLGFNMAWLAAIYLTFQLTSIPFALPSDRKSVV